MKVWRWTCKTHVGLGLLTLQNGDLAPLECSPLVDIAYPDDGPCWFVGSPVLDLFPIPDRAQSIPSGQGRRVGQSAGTPRPSSAPRHFST